MFTNSTQNVKCLWNLLIFCIIFVCVTIIYLEQSPTSFTSVVLQTQRFGSVNELFDLVDFKYVLESRSCEDEIFAILIVTSYAGDVETRSAVRQAYPERLLKELGIRRVFLLALIDPERNINQVQQNAIKNEHERFDDIVQGNFIEDYRNLTYKNVMGLRWAAQNCQRAMYAIKMDHDIIVDLFAFVTMLKKLPKRDFLLAGNVLANMQPERDPANKWFVTREEYSKDVYPDYLSGWLYLTNPNTALKLYETSRIVPYFWVDDTYVTGILAERLGLNLVRLNKYYTMQTEQIKCCIAHPNYTCDYWVGPNGGENKLIIAFEKYLEDCSKTYCQNMTRERKCGE